MFLFEKNNNEMRDNMQKGNLYSYTKIKVDNLTKNL